MPAVRSSAIRSCRLSPQDRTLRPLARSLAWIAPCLGLLAGEPASGQAAAPAAAAPKKVASERLKLSTSDGVALAAWYYPAAKPEADDATDDKNDEKSGPTPVVILLHDLGGSHAAVEPLALELQSRGMAVVAPDLRGHGATKGPAGSGDSDLDAKSLKKADFVGMTVTGGGRVRDQAAQRGDVEAVRNWIKGRAEAEGLAADRLVVLGSGLGASVAAQWTIADAAWPDIASGPQGRQVRGLVLVSPAWIVRGFSVSPALAAEPVRRTLPILVIGGANDSDAVKLYDQLKRQRPDEWSEKRAGQDLAQAPKLADGALPSLYLRQFDTDMSGDRLAAFVPKDRRGGGLPVDIIAGFIGRVTAEEQ